ncbi:hypothetical protein BGZ51_001256 [Haplosporangium sp. Z 767]|nr:hypothetical protein BGZ51_001256 [Haplosporangium sp. Z 767]
MRFPSIAPLLAATIQGLLIAGAPMNGTNDYPTLQPLLPTVETLNYDAYHEATMGATNITERDLLRMRNTRLRAVPNIMTLITCAAVAKDKPLRVMEFSDVHSYGFELHAYMNYLAIFMQSSQADIDFMTKHCKEYSKMYKRVNIRRTMDSDRLLIT